MNGLLHFLLRNARTPLGNHFQKSQAGRRNTPSGAEDQVWHRGLPAPDLKSRLWVVDRILEPQTVAYFFEFTMHGRLPSGRQTTLPIFSGKDSMLLSAPMSTWAAAPFSKQERPLAFEIMNNVGSDEDPNRLQLVSKELMAMKSRVWEGIMPLSERRWIELGLDSPTQFHQACQFISAVTDVFHYLNLANVRPHLRETYNLIWGHLDQFDKALEGIETNSPPGSSMAALWHEYIKDHYNYIAQRSHRWVIEHVDRLRAPIFQQLSNEVVRPPGGGNTELELALADKLHDLMTNASQADHAIIIPMDGYKGGTLPSEDDVQIDESGIREEPIQFSANPLSRKADYFLRLRYLTYAQAFQPENLRDSTVVGISKDQIRAQLQTRQELRGIETRTATPERWVSRANWCLAQDVPIPWGYIGYRTCYDHSDEDWKQFTTRFEGDIANWGSELQDTAALRKLCKVEWRDIREEVAERGDGIIAAKRSFASLATDEEAMRGYNQDVFLVADKATINSYLHPADGDTGHVLAVEGEWQKKDPARADDSPGFNGWLRVPGSLLWDDVSALMFTQTQLLDDLWPLAQNDAQNVYRHPLGPVKGQKDEE